jgi:hypothetical protein
MSKFGTILDYLLFIYGNNKTKDDYCYIKNTKSQCVDYQVFKLRGMDVNLNHQSKER